MEERHIKLVQESFEKVTPNGEQYLADVFYSILFKLDPSLRPLFPSDMSKQRMKLITVLTMAVRGLEDMDDILPTIRRIGVQHLDYNVKEEYYTTLGKALIMSIRWILGDEFTPEIQEAWAHVYNMLASTMIEAGREAQRISSQS